MKTSHFLNTKRSDKNASETSPFDFWGWSETLLYFGTKGDDDITTGDENDIVFSGWGNDTIFTAEGDDKVHSGKGDDLITTGLGKDVILAGLGDDTVFAGLGDDTIFAGRGDDVVYAGLGDDIVFAGFGHDTVWGGGGDDSLAGGAGYDTAVFSGSVLDFSWQQGWGNRLIVQDQNTADGDEGEDTLKQFEALQFDDFTFVLGGDNAPLIIGDDQSTDEDNAVSFDLSAYDLDGGTLSLDSFSITTSTGAALSLVLDSTTALSPLMGTGALYNFSFDPEGHYQFLAAGEGMDETLTVTVSDGDGNSSSLDILVTVTGENDAPEALDDTLDTTEDSGIISIDLNLLISDVDLSNILDITAVTASGDPVIFTLLGGVVSFDANQFGYLNTGEDASFDLTYTVDDNSGTANATDTGVVTVNVEGITDNTAPVAPDDILELDEDFGVVIIDLNLLVSDVDAGDILTVTAVTVSGDPVTLAVVDGVVTLDTEQYNAMAIGDGVSFDLEYTVQDDSGAPNDTATGTVTVNIAGRNDAPVVVSGPLIAVDEADFATQPVAADQLVSIDLKPLASDVDLGDALSFSILSITDDSDGRRINIAYTLTDGVLTFDPVNLGLDLGDILNASINFKVSDGTTTTSGTQALQVTGSADEATPNTAPVALDATFTEDDEGLILIDLSTLVSDADSGDVLTVGDVSFLGAGRAGAVTFTLIGDVVTIDPAQFGLTDGAELQLIFSYQVDDGSGTVNRIDTGAVTIDITGVPTPSSNTAPVALDDTVNASDDGGNIVIDLNALVSDPDSDPLTIGAITLTVGGIETDVLFDLSGGILTIDPTQFAIADGAALNGVLSYTVDDGTGTVNATATGAIALNITGAIDPVETNNAPITVLQSRTVNLDVSTAPHSFDLSAFAFDLDSDPLTFTALSFTYNLDSGEGGVITTVNVAYTLVGTVVSFDPTQFGLLDAESLDVAFNYSVDDGTGASNSSTTGTVNVTITDPLDVEPPFVETSYLLDFEPFADSGDFTVDITNYEQFVFSGDVQVYETDEVTSGTGGRGGSLPDGVFNGVVSGDNVLVLQADGSLSIGGPGAGATSVNRLGSFDLDSIYLTSAVTEGMAVTITTQGYVNVDVSDEYGFPAGTVFEERVQDIGSFDFVVGTVGATLGTADTFIDFDDFSDITGSQILNSDVFNDITSLSITTDGGSGDLLVIDDLAATVVSETIYNIF